MSGTDPVASAWLQIATQPNKYAALCPALNRVTAQSPFTAACAGPAPLK